MTWWNVIKDAGGIMSSGGAGGDGLETNVSYSSIMEKIKVGEEEVIDGESMTLRGYKCRRCNKVHDTKPKRDECERQCMIKDLRNRDKRVEPGRY